MIKRAINNHLEIIYILLWVVLGTIHFFLLRKVYGLEAIAAFADSMVFNGLFMMLGAGLWFMVRYSSLQNRSFGEMAFYHLTVATITVLAWLGIGYLIMKNSLSADESYQEFLQASMTFRAVTGVMVYALLVTVYYLMLNYRELRERNEKEARLTALLKETELSLLRSQIRPHFLFNSLNSISSLTMTDPAKAQEMVIKLSEFMRYSLNFLDARMSTLEKDLYHADLYLDIEKVRFGNKLIIERKVEAGLGEWKVPAMILQPLLENAVKFGVYEAEQPVTIVLTARKEGKLLLVSIGNSFEPGSAPKKGTGTGLKNVTARMANLYGQGDLVKIIRSDNYFTVELKIPSDVT